MVDFRKCILALAVVAFLVGSAVTANAQGLVPAFQCQGNAGVPPTVRAEGITELVGDIILTCTGGTATPANVAVQQANISVTLNTNITSRLLNDPWTEALMIIDEPGTLSNPNVPQLPCGGKQASTVNTGTLPLGTSLTPVAGSAPDNGAGVCSINGTGNGVGTYNGTNGRPNVFQGRTSPGQPNQIVFLGVPLDPPGTNNNRIVRITNIRANASQLGTSSTLVPSQIAAYVSITASTSIPVTNPQQTVAFIQPGLIFSTRNTVFNFNQCNNANKDIAGDTSKGLNTPSQNQAQFSLRYDEGFASSFKTRNVNFDASGQTSPTPLPQASPGAIYNTETGFYNNTFGSTGFGGNLGNAGLADFGTRLRAQFNNIPAGVQLFVPVLVPLVRLTDNKVTGWARLTSTDANGGTAFSAVASTSPGGLMIKSATDYLLGGTYSCPSGNADNTCSTGPVAPVTVTTGSALAVWEVTADDPTNFERAEIPVAVAFLTNTGSNLPGLGTGTVNGSFAPISTVTTASASAPIPRFVDSSAPKNIFTVIQCVCNLLFPFVTNQAGFDTGVAIANTSQDPFGTTPQQGTVTLNYYGGTTGGGAAPAVQVSQVVPAGGELVFTLSSGGNLGIAATPGFQGYIISTSRFQYCHGFAFISDLGAQKLAEGYLAIGLDDGSLTRGTVGEVKAH